MATKTKRVNQLITVLIAVTFCVCVFLIVMVRYQLWPALLSDDNTQDSYEIVNAQTEWLHKDFGQGTGVGNVWTTLLYERTGWSAQPAPFAVSISPEADCPTAFFVTEFQVDDPDDYGYLEGTIAYNDTALVYLNGDIIFAGNIPENGYASNYDYGACNAIDSVVQTNFVATDLDSLQEGTNVLAVEIHSASENNTKTYFNMPTMNIVRNIYEEDPPTSTSVLLRKCSAEDTMMVELITEDPVAYELEYIQRPSSDLDEHMFELYATDVIMSNEALEDGLHYRKVATMPRLKEGTEYVYHFVKVGGVDTSVDYTFTTARDQDTSFLALGNVPYERINTQGVHEAWQADLQTAIDLAGQPDYFILSPNISTIQHLSQPEITMRAQTFTLAPLLKTVPSIMPDAFVKASADNLRGHSAYMNAMSITLDDSDTDYDAIKAYISALQATMARRWTIVSVDGQAVSDALCEVLCELNVDLVLVNGGSDYALKMQENEPVYVYGGANATSVHVKVNTLDIITYDLDSAQQVEQVTLKLAQ